MTKDMCCHISICHSPDLNVYHVFRDRKITHIVGSKSSLTSWVVFGKIMLKFVVQFLRREGSKLTVFLCYCRWLIQQLVLANFVFFFTESAQ